MARPFPIGDQSEGINLVRFKGGASPRALFDLVNAWVTPQKVIAARPGCGDPYARAPGTVGGIEFEDKIHVFAGEPVGNTDPLIEVHVLRHPTGAPAALSAVHQAFTFLGRIYAVAEWEDGTIKHFWLQQQPEWTADTLYNFGDVVSPTVDNGFIYEITNDLGIDTWAAAVETVVPDEVLPTVPNGLKYRATAVSGAPARTSDIEPTWPTTEGGTVTEYRSG